MAAFEVEKITVITALEAESIAALVGQLSSSAKAPTSRELEAIVNAPGTVLLGARQSGRLVGMLTLVISPFRPASARSAKTLSSMSNIAGRALARLSPKGLWPRRRQPAQGQSI